MANPEHLAKLNEGVDAWNAWRAEIQLVEADLSNAVVTGANLTGADLARTDLSNTHLVGGILIEASLFGSNFISADLSQTDLTGTDLTEANFIGTDLAGANFRNAEFGYTVFADVDLSRTLNLNHCRHAGPSSIGIDTIYRSGGKIPDVFLRGCGVPDTFIAYAKSLIGSPIEFYSCFISYSTKDQEFAERLHADLQAKGVRCWFAPHKIQAGKKIHEQIDEAIRVYDKLLLVLSPNSMESKWVKTEIAKARKRETREGKRMLFPLRLVEFDTLREWECFDGDTGKDSAREIREYFLPDFSEWKTNHNAYREAFERLLRDLKAGEG